MIGYLLVFLLSMVPVLELRFAIPFGALRDLSPVWTYIAAVAGNMVPVPFILLLVPHVLDFMERHRIFPRLVRWVREKAQRGAAKIEKRANIGLFLFVAVPLPGTGAWTGTLVAALFGLRKWHALLSVFAGVLAAGLVMTLASFGIVEAFRFFL